MRTRRPEEPLDPRIAADLETVDRALGGMPVDQDDADLAGLALLLRAERSAAEPCWAATLDERAAAGFPRKGGRGPKGRRSSRLGSGGWLLPAGAVATLAVVVVVASSTLGGGGTSDSTSGDQAAVGTDAARGPGRQAGPGQLSPAAPGSVDSLNGSLSEPYPLVRAARDDKIAPGAENRKVDRNTQLTLSAKPEDVRGVSDEVISITRSLDGIVASSRVSESNGNSTATLDLTLPTRNVDTALDRMTDLADVDALNETAEDITKPFVSAQDRVHDARAKRRELLEALGNATTDAEANALTIRVADARREIARAQAAFDRIARKARLSDLSVTVTSNPNATDERTLGDWFDDAVDVLRGIAGVLLVSAAILIPLGLIAAIAAWVASRLRRRSRERTLD
jgi:Domain of unknown function (DUF4349)